MLTSVVYRLNSASSAHLAPELLPQPELLLQSSLGSRVHDVHPPPQRPPRPSTAIAVLERQALAGTGELCILCGQSEKVLLVCLACLTGLQSTAEGFSDDAALQNLPKACT